MAKAQTGSEKGRESSIAGVAPILRTSKRKLPPHNSMFLQLWNSHRQSHLSKLKIGQKMWTLHYNRFAKKDEMFPNWDLRGFILTSNFAAATAYYVDLWEDFLSGLCVYATFCPFIQKSIWTALLEQNRSFPETKDVLHWGHIVHPNTWCEIVCLWFQHFWHLKGYQCIDAWKSTVCGHFVSWNIGACEQNYVFF